MKFPYLIIIGTSLLLIGSAMNQAGFVGAGILFIMAGHEREEI